MTTKVDIQIDREPNYIDQAVAYYNHGMEVADKRVEKWFFMETPLAATIVLISYIIVVIIGPKIMANRKPFQLKWTIFVYNMFLVILSVYMFKEVLLTSFESNYSYLCQPVDYSVNRLSMRMANVVWVFFISKIIELLDTVFFILRKKNDQLSFLHIFHHCSMIFSCWLMTKFTPGGQAFFLCMLNSFVHIFMYSYYALSTFGPRIQKFLWWKRHITKLQLLQFFSIAGHTFYSLVSGCDFPVMLNILLILFDISFIFLFGNFYYKAYTLRQREKCKSS